MALASIIMGERYSSSLCFDDLVHLSSCLHRISLVAYAETLPLAIDCMYDPSIGINELSSLLATNAQMHACC